MPFDPKPLLLLVTFTTSLAACSEDFAGLNRPPSGYVNEAGEPCDLTPGLEPPPGYTLDTLGTLAGLETAATINSRRLEFTTAQRGYLLSLQLTSGNRVAFARSDDGGATWRRMPFPESRDPRGMACRGRDTCVVTVQARGGALGYVTLDGGDTWTTIEPHLNIEELAGVQFDRLGRLYATTQGFSGGRIVRSDDHGLSWRTVGEQTAVRRVGLVPGQDSLLFALAEGGRLVAMDTSGAILYETTVPLRGNFTTDELRAFDRDRLHVANFRTLFRSADGGRTWDSSPQPIARLIGFETPAAGIAVTTEEQCIDYDVGLSRDVFAVTDDGGDSWEKATVRTSNLSRRIRLCDYLGEGEWRCVMNEELIAIRLE